MYKLPERRGGGGGEVIWAMPERKHSFLHEVFPKLALCNCLLISPVCESMKVLGYLGLHGFRCLLRSGRPPMWRPPGLERAGDPGLWWPITVQRQADESLFNVVKLYQDCLQNFQAVWNESRFARTSETFQIVGKFPYFWQILANVFFGSQGVRTSWNTFVRNSAIHLHRSS